MYDSRFRTITNRFDSICRRCGEPVPAGAKVRWAKGRGIYHLTAVCPGANPAKVEEAFADFEV